MMESENKLRRVARDLHNLQVLTLLSNFNFKGDLRILKCTDFRLQIEVSKLPVTETHHFVFSKLDIF